MKFFTPNSGPQHIFFPTPQKGRNSAVLVEWGKRQSPYQRQLHLGFIVSVQTQVGKVEVAAWSSGSWPFLTLIRLVLFAFGLVVGLGLDKVVALIGT